MRLKQQVIDNFSSRASAYDDHANVQFLAAIELARDLNFHTEQLVAGPILEIGCGTGSLTLALIDSFPDRNIVVSDVSPQMLEQCHRRIIAHASEIPKNVELKVIDGENFLEPDTYAAIISSFTLHWLSDLDSALTSLLRSLKPDGFFVFAVPSSQSFPEWKKVCVDSKIPFTGNPLPSASFFRDKCRQYGYLSEIREESFTHTYSSMLHFLRDLKALGASTSLSGHSLTVKQLLTLINYSNDVGSSAFPLTYSIIFGRITRS